MGREAMCYGNGERGYKWIAAPFCTRHTGVRSPGPRCPGPLGKPYKAHIWNPKDPNAAGDRDLCNAVAVRNVCPDKQTLCATKAECQRCKADGSMVVLSGTNKDRLFSYLSVNNFDTVRSVSTLWPTPLST